MTEATGINTVPEIVWNDDEILRPGMDFKEGVVYVTIPAIINETVTVGRGKSERQQIKPVHGLACVTSDRRQFPFNQENVATLGFSYPPHVMVPLDRRWSSTGIRVFLGQRENPIAPAVLHDGLRSIYEEYIEFANENYYDVMPLFIMGSYLFRLYKSLGYIHFNGSAASGKSQNLRILDALAFNTAWASSMSSAALYRSLAGNPGTVCIDEAEGWEGERGEELRRILNAGYLDGSTVKRAEKGQNDQFIVASFESYGPKAIASINPLDAVIGSRCLIVAMRPAIRIIREFDKDDPRWQTLRDRLYIWMMTHGPAVARRIEAWNETIRFDRCPTLVGRQWQITQMYLTLADYIDSFDHGTRCAKLIAFFIEYFDSLQRQQDAGDRIRLLLRVLPEVLRTKTAFDGGWYHIKTVHEIMATYIEEDAKEYYKTRSVSKHLEVLSFKKRRASKQGQQVWLDADQIRQEFRQRRVEPVEEDKQWFLGEIEYVPADDEPVPPAGQSDNLWAGLVQEEEE